MSCRSRPGKIPTPGTNIRQMIMTIPDFLILRAGTYPLHEAQHVNPCPWTTTSVEVIPFQHSIFMCIFEMPATACSSSGNNFSSIIP
jgi:hypothetical protein